MAPCFIGDAGGATQLPQEVTIQCATREAANTQRDDGDQVLQAVKFTDKKVLQRYFQVSPKLLGFGEACPGVLKVSCCGVASRALRNLATSVSMI